MHSSTTRILFIDIQEEYAPGVGDLSIEAGRWKNAISGIMGLNRFAQASGIGRSIVIHKGFGNHFQGKNYFLADSLGGELDRWQEFAKTTPSAYQNANLVRSLGDNGVRTVVLAGFQSHYCIASTAFDLVQNGFKVIVLEDCCASPPVDGVGGEEMHRAAMKALGQFGTCEILTLADWMDAA